MKFTKKQIFLIDVLDLAMQTLILISVAILMVELFKIGHYLTGTVAFGLALWRMDVIRNFKWGGKQ